ncbi:GDP-mannose 4,6-dehydratase [Patescibacteria group bacterium]|nr:GDP-mannose 4,6-dehydratase [Patescibacteria group bacterium]MCL5409634.1 GDP-mannose 4,6-dehydratase [Patescibacteria group bacterium]
MKKKKAFITGITGQDGSYLTELLLAKGYLVGGLIRRNAGNDLGNIKHLKSELKLYHGDMHSADSISLALSDFKPDEIYNLASQSSPLASFTDRLGTVMVTGVGAMLVFDKAKEIVPKAKVYQASTSEMFGAPKQIPQNEDTIFSPANPYAVAKEFAHRMAILARQDHKKAQFISCGILFNHESPRRGLQFITRKVSVAVACIKNGLKNSQVPLNEIGQPIIQNGKLRVGDLSAQRDWGYAPDYVEAMWRILQQDEPDDFVIATGEVHSVKELCQEAFAVAGLDWKKYVITDNHFVPPVQTGPLCGDYRKAKKIIGWEPKTTFSDLVKIMVEADIKNFS